MVLLGCLLFLSVCSSGFQELPSVEASFSVHIVGMHLYLNGLSNEAIHISGFCREYFCVLESDVILIETVLGYC